MNTQESFHRGETLSLVGRYATPLAAVLIGMGLLFAPLSRSALHVGFCLMIFSLTINFAFIPMVAGLSDHARGALAKFRATLNLWINVVLVFLLGRTWPLVWLLFVLSSSATAIYGTRQRTLINAFFLSAVLGIINYLHGFNTPLRRLQKFGLILL